MGLIGVLFMASACTSGQMDNADRQMYEEIVTGQPDMLALDTAPDIMSLMSIAHNFSGGSVDIYDPSAATFDIPEPPKKPLVRPLPFPLNQTYKPKDGAVTMYSLTIPGEDLPVIELDIVKAPVPLTNDKPADK